MSQSANILDILSGKKLHIEVVGMLPPKYENEATNNPHCFVGGSYATCAATEILGVTKIPYNDIDVYIGDAKHAIEGSKYQNILLDKREFGPINIRTASLVINMYDLACCQFFIYNNMVFGTQAGIKALETSSFTVMKEFMGCIETIGRVHKYRHRGFNIKTSQPDRFLALNYYGPSIEHKGNIINYPRSYSDTLRYVFNIVDGKIQPNGDKVFEPPSLLKLFPPSVTGARLVNNNKKYLRDGSEHAIWHRVKDLPGITSCFSLTDLIMNDNLIIMEFTCESTRVTYIIDIKQHTGYYTTSCIKTMEKPYSIKFWDEKLPYLGIHVTDSGVYIRH